MNEPEKEVNFCPLCNGVGLSFFHQDRYRSYLQCSACSLIFVPVSERLNPAEEKGRYDLHRNSPDDINYRKFLSCVFIPMQKLIAPKSRGLDFGSGPGPTLSLMFKEAGHRMSIYDCYYNDDVSVFENLYDFITASEVAEHLFEPGKEINRLWSCLKPGGYMGIMTKLVPENSEFASWHYKNDSTHVCFFNKSTFEWLAENMKAGLNFTDKDVIILQKTNLL